MTDLSGFEPNVEAIAGYEPDLVVTSDGNDLAAQLGALGIERLGGPGAVDASTTSTPRSSSSARPPVTSPRRPSSSPRCRPTSTAIVAATPPVRGAADRSTTSSTRRSSASTRTRSSARCTACSVCRTSPTRPRATPAATRSSAPSSSSRQDPDLIFLADTKCCGETPRHRRRPSRLGRRSPPSVNGLVFAMDDDIASRWGPRIVEYVRDVAAAVEQAAAVPTGADTASPAVAVRHRREVAAPSGRPLQHAGRAHGRGTGRRCRARWPSCSA